MGKRSNFERLPRDFYPTPKSAVDVLTDFEAPSFFVEPCAGDGQLVRHLQDEGWKCLHAYDIKPRAPGITAKDALTLTQNDVDSGYKDIFIVTNPPWSRPILHRMINHFVSLRPTWLLLDADWMHTKQSADYVARYCTVILSVGRVKWIPNSPGVGKDNVAWYLFDKNKEHLVGAEFFGR